MHGAVNLNVPISYVRIVKMISFFFLRYLLLNPSNSIIIVGKRLYINFILMRRCQFTDCHNIDGFHILNLLIFVQPLANFRYVHRSSAVISSDRTSS